MTETKKPRGFAAMDKAKQLELARKGGKFIPAEKRSFSRNRELAIASGRKGGKAVSGKKRSFSTNLSLAKEAGKKGGAAFRETLLRKAREQNQA